MTPPKHVNFHAKKLFGEMGRIVDGSVAYIELNGGGPTELHTHEHNHLFIVTEGDVFIINGSPRVAKFSNTDKIIHSFVKGLEEAGITWKLHNLSSRKEWETAREAFLTHERILIAFPLYVECMPSVMLEFLEKLPSERKQPAQLSFLLHGGMDEGNEFRFWLVRKIVSLLFRRRGKSPWMPQ